MRKIINAFRDMPPREMMDCRIRVLRHFMKYYGLDIDSFVLLLLGQGVGFDFYKEESGGQSNLVLWGVGATNSFIEEEILKSMEIPHERHVIDDTSNGWEKLKAFVDNNTPVIVKLESGYLNENNIVKKQGSQRHLGGISSAGLVGYDTDSSKVYLDFLTESMEETPGYLHEAYLENFMISRNTNSFPHSPQNKCYTFSVPEGYDVWLNKNIKNLLHMNLIRICENMLNVNKASCEASGINGIRELSSKLDDFGSIIKEADLERHLLDKLFLIKLRTLRLGMTIGSFTLYRDEFGQALKMVSERIGNNKLDKIGREFTKAGKQWRDAARLLAACEYKLGDKNKYLCQLSEQIRNLANVEETLFYRLHKLLA